MRFLLLCDSKAIASRGSGRTVDDRTSSSSPSSFPQQRSVYHQERIVQAGAVPAIMALSAGEGLDMASQRRCAAALCNLACAPANVPRMVEVCNVALCYDGPAHRRKEIKLGQSQ